MVSATSWGTRAERLGSTTSCGDVGAGVMGVKMVLVLVPAIAAYFFVVNHWRNIVSTV